METPINYLNDSSELVKRAFYLTSHSPDKRGEQTIQEHNQMLVDDLKQIPDSEHNRYIVKFKFWFETWLTARSKCASSMITGPANFNVRKAEKANRRESDLYTQFMEWRNKTKKTIKKKIEAAKSPEQKESEAWLKLKRNIASSAKIIHDLNNGIGHYNKVLFVNSIFTKTETFAKRGEVDIVEKAIAFIREINEKFSVVITERHKFFQLAEVAKKHAEKFQENTTKENTEAGTFEGGRMEYNHGLDRIQFFFDEIPSAEIRNLIKRNGFKWAPSQSAWQRQMTANGVAVAKQILIQLSK